MASDLQHRIRRLFGFILLAFLVLIGWQSYWHLAKSDWLLAQPTNRRLQRAERNIPRGTVYDRRGEKLAWTEDGTRHYADPRATSAVLGYLDPVYGRAGVEGEWDLELAGLSRTFTPRELERILRDEKPRGNDLVLTLDLSLQRAALDALGDRKGAVAVLDPETGGILALATAPTFDASTLGKDYATLLKDPDGPLRNRASQDLYPPGSTMKLVTAAAALGHGVEADTRYTCKGVTTYEGIKITDYHGAAHGTVGMKPAVVKSCNYYFARTALALGSRKLNETAEAFGFGRRWWDALHDPRILPLSIATSSMAPDMTATVPAGDLAQMGYGQSTVVATPLQMAMVPAAIANEGTLMSPYLVRQVRKGGTNEELSTFESKPVGYPMTRDAAEELSEMMRGVVTGGTARGASVSGLTVYGKTGTAQQGGGEDHAWFVGYAERDNNTDRIAFAVVLERGGTGGRVAVPVARKVLEAWKAEK